MVNGVIILLLALDIRASCLLMVAQNRPEKSFDDRTYRHVWHKHSAQPSLSLCSNLDAVYAEKEMHQHN